MITICGCIWACFPFRGAGGNIGLMGAIGPFTVSVLQTFDPGISEQTIERSESLWKDKLGARLVGYNLH